MLYAFGVSVGLLWLALWLERRRLESIPLSTSEWCERMRRIGLGKK
jgi:hypothetical protein